MTTSNPFSSDGTFSALDRFAVFDEEYRRTEKVLTGWVRAGRMRKANCDHKLGALKEILEDLRVKMQAEVAQTCQWAETGNASGVARCSSCGEAYAMKLEQRPACPKGHAA